MIPFTNLITLNLTVILTCCAAQVTLTVALSTIFLAFATILLAISFAVAKEKSYEWIFAWPPASFPVHIKGCNALNFSILLPRNIVPSDNPSAHHPYVQCGSCHALLPNRLPQVQTHDQASLHPPCPPFILCPCCVMAFFALALITFLLGVPSFGAIVL
jgi:hypothetical protein